MRTPETSRHFERFVDPVTRVESYVLRTKVAGQQQSFYFVNPAMDDGGRYLWFLCAFPPAAYMTLGVVDFEDDEVRHFPQTQYIGGPLVDLETGECLFGAPTGFYRRSPKAKGSLTKLCDVPEAIRRYGAPRSLATHLTYSPDKRELFVDARVGDRFIAGTLELASGRFCMWHEWDYCKNHGQFNPMDPNLALMAEDFWTDADNHYNLIRYNDRGEFQRLWTVTRGGRARMHPPLNEERATHEWWSHDGRKIYYCSYTREEGNKCVASLNLATGEHKVLAPVRAWHAFSSRDDSFLTYDENDTFYRGTPSRVGFYDIRTGKGLYVVSQNPALASPEAPSNYHLDPHPQFVGGERYICHTLAQRGEPEVALTPVAPLLARTR